MMKSMSVVLMLSTGIVAQAFEVDTVDDTVSLLQSQVEEKRGNQRQARVAEVSELDIEDEYQDDSLKECSSKSGTDSKSDGVNTNLCSAPEQLSADAPGASTKTSASTEPSGASTLRMLLQFMTIMIVLDALRRWHAQTTTYVAPKVAGYKPAKKNESEDTAAWVEMVNAAKSGDADGFCKALKKDPSMTRSDAWGCTPLHFAAEGGSAAICKSIVERLQQARLVDALDAGDETPLHIAARTGHTPVCEVLLNAGAGVNAVNKDGMTPLVVAGRAGREGTCRILADHGAGVAGLSDEELPPMVVSQIVRKVFAA